MSISHWTFNQRDLLLNVCNKKQESDFIESALSFSFTFTDDFNIEEASVVFDSNSIINSTACFTFSPVNDEIIEEDEVFLFTPNTTNTRDMFMIDSSVISVLLYDDDSEYADVFAFNPFTVVFRRCFEDVFHNNYSLHSTEAIHT